MTTTAKLSTLHKDHQLQISFSGKLCEITIITFGGSGKCEKYGARFEGNFCGAGESGGRVMGEGHCVWAIGQFASQEQFCHFMGCTANYEIDLPKGLLTLKWKLVANEFHKRIQYRINLTREPLSQKQSLKCEVIILRRKLVHYQKVGQIMEKRNEKRRKIFTKEQQMNKHESDPLQKNSNEKEKKKQDSKLQNGNNNSGSFINQNKNSKEQTDKKDKSKDKITNRVKQKGSKKSNSKNGEKMMDISQQMANMRIEINQLQERSYCVAQDEREIEIFNQPKEEQTQRKKYQKAKEQRRQQKERERGERQKNKQKGKQQEIKEERNKEITIPISVYTCKQKKSSDKQSSSRSEQRQKHNDKPSPKEKEQEPQNREPQDKDEAQNKKGSESRSDRIEINREMEDSEHEIGDMEEEIDIEIEGEDFVRQGQGNSKKEPSSVSSVKERSRDKFILSEQEKQQSKNNQSELSQKQIEQGLNKSNNICQLSRQSKKIEQSQRQRSQDKIQKLREEEDEEQIVEVDNPNSNNFKRTLIGNNVRVDYSDGDYYFGQMKDELFHGQGLYYSKRNGTYKGEWKEGRATGYGTTVDIEGNRHEGLYLNDARHGKGKDWYPNGQRYQGDFQDNSKEGYGTYYYSNGDIYEGEWMKDMCHGRGKEIYPNGSYYVGLWKNDDKDGEGKLFTLYGVKRQVYEAGELVEEEDAMGRQ